MRLPLEQRFWSKVEKHDDDCPCCPGCWHWTGARQSAEYGVIRLPGREGGLILAHRLSLILDGRDPGELHARHSCDHPWCVNPSHLKPGTRQENADDAVARQRMAGDRNGRSRLTVADVLAIRARAAAGENQSAIAADYGICQPNVSDIHRRRRWAHAEAA